VSDRATGVVVVFRESPREEWLERFKSALLLMENVATIEDVPETFDDLMARSRINREWAVKMFEIGREALGAKTKE